MSEIQTNSKRVLSPKERKTAQSRGDDFTAILDAARAVMREEGWRHSTCTKLHVGLGCVPLRSMNTGLSKMALYDALYGLGIRLLRTGARTTASPHLRSRFFLGPWCVRELEHYMRFAQQNPELYHLVFERPVPGFVPEPESLEERRTGSLEQ